jgi:hypothetical protein
VDDDMVEKVQQHLRACKDEQEALERQRANLEQSAAAAAEADQEVEEALATFAGLGEVLRDSAGEATVTNAVAAYVARVELEIGHTDHGKRRSCFLKAITVHFRPLGAILKPLAVSLAPSALGSRCSPAAGRG